MTNAQRKKLADLIQGRVGSDAVVAASVAGGAVTLFSRLITTTSIYAAVGFAEGLKLAGALRSMSASSDAATALQGSEILRLLDPIGPGVDVGLAEVRGVIDQLASVGVMSAETAAAVKALGEVRSLDFIPDGKDVADARQLNQRIAAQSTARQSLADAYNRRADVADRVLASLSSGELVDVVTDLDAL